MEYFVKWQHASYLHCEWVTPACMKEEGRWGPMKMKKFVQSPAGQEQLNEEEERALSLKDVRRGFGQRLTFSPTQYPHAHEGMPVPYTDRPVL